MERRSSLSGQFELDSSVIVWHALQAALSVAAVPEIVPAVWPSLIQFNFLRHTWNIYIRTWIIGLERRRLHHQKKVGLKF